MNSFCHDSNSTILVFYNTPDYKGDAVQRIAQQLHRYLPTVGRSSKKYLSKGRSSGAACISSRKIRVLPGLISISASSANICRHRSISPPWKRDDFLGVLSKFCLANSRTNHVFPTCRAPRITRGLRPLFFCRFLFVCFGYFTRVLCPKKNKTQGCCFAVIS